MTTYNWASAVTGGWDSPSSWSPYGGPFDPAPFVPYGPGVVDSVLFDTGSRRPYTVIGGGAAVSFTVSHDNVTFADFVGSNGGGLQAFDVDDGATVTLESNSNIDFVVHYLAIGGTLTVNNATFLDQGIVTADQDFGRGANVAVDGPQAKMAGSSSELDAGSVLTIENGGAYVFSSQTIDGIVRIEGPTSIFSGTEDLGKGAIIELEDGAIGGDNNPSITPYTADIVPYGGLGTVDKGATVIGSGTIYPAAYGDSSRLSTIDITNNGSITASGGTLTILGSVSGTGTLGIDRGSTLELGGDASNNVVFLDQATLQIDKGIEETGFLQNFQTGDSVILAQETITSETSQLSGHNTILDLYDGSTLTDQLTFVGHFTSAAFNVAEDNAGGSVVTLDPHLFHAPTLTS